jgi:hypothetical protein
MIIFIAGLVIGMVIGMVIGYRYCMFVHSPKMSAYNRRWQKWRDKQTNCVACDKPAAMACVVGKRKVKTWFCRVHFLEFHQEVPGTYPMEYACKHPALVGAAGKKK